MPDTKANVNSEEAGRSGSMAARFLVAFNQIEQHLSRRYSEGHYMPFSQLVSRAEEEDAHFRAFALDLREMADLRNAIVHHRMEPGYVIAEPHPETVERIEYIRDQVLAPERVISRFKRPVITVRPEDPLTVVLQFIRDRGFAQFPVYAEGGGRYRGLLTEHGITRWLASHFGELDSLQQVKVEDVLPHEGADDRAEFVGADTTLFEVRERFAKRPAGAPALNALLITEHGRPEEDLLGIITARDVAGIGGRP